MSFMSGFADAFGRQMEIGAQNRENAKQDAFKLAYGSYLTKQEQYKADEAKDRAYVEQAKTITQVAGAPPEAWTHVYRMVKGGYTNAAIEERLKSMQFASTQTPAMPEGSDPSLANASQQMANGAMGQTATQPVNTVPQTGQFTLDPAQQQARRVAQANQQVMGQTGVTQEQFDTTMGGYQAQNPTDTMTATPIQGTSNGAPDPGNDGFYGDNDSATMIMKDGSQKSVLVTPNGIFDRTNPSVKYDPSQGQIVDSATAGQIRSLYGSIATDSKQIVEDRSLVKSIGDDLYGLTKMAKENPNVISAAGGISNVWNQIGNELTSLQSQFSGKSDDEVTNMLNQYEQKVLQQGNSLLPNADKDSMDREVFQSKLTSTVFKYARLLNGSGQLTQKDFDAALNAVKTSNDPENFAASAKEILKGRINAVDSSSSEFMKSNANVIGARTSFNDSMGSSLDTMFGPLENELSPETLAWLKEAVADNANDQPNTLTDEDAKLGSGNGSVKIIKLDAEDAKEFGVPEGTEAKITPNGIAVKGVHY